MVGPTLREERNIISLQIFYILFTNDDLDTKNDLHCVFILIFNVMINNQCFFILYMHFIIFVVGPAGSL